MTIFQDRKNNFSAGFGFKLAAIIGLTLIFLIPQALIGSLVGEREALRDEMLASINTPLGGQPSFAGPYIIVPALVNRPNAQGVLSPSYTRVFFMPETGKTAIKAVVEKLQRGIYRAPIANAEISIAFRFNAQEAKANYTKAYDLDWSQASLAVAIPDARLLSKDALFIEGGSSPVRMKGGEATFSRYGRLLSVPLAPAAAGRTLKESEGIITFSLRGGGRISLAPAGGDASVSMEANWPSPSFDGFVLPTERALDKSGFTASWYVPESVQAVPSAFLEEDWTDKLENGEFGVSLIEPVDAYRKASRAIKYAILFIIAPFAILFLFEVFTLVRIHPVQYVLVGMANMIFYVLLLSVSEHSSFGLAYLMAALATSLVTGLYYKSVSRSHKAWPLGGLCAASLYGILYAILLSEDYALLIGSVVLFAITAGLMWATRNVNWYKQRRMSGASGDTGAGEGNSYPEQT